ncbi:hypothetical protein FSP39_020556 [Pinctada imbricata]|uniref:Outer dynein arm-docking complex subunit 4 n=1 Tax=Pinctada imbricata TaxID=66713 RepID=A0AA88YV45_PINIB|nr:hypothetical protein FSP39_020556 [Pinctada imbricata]
MTVSLLGPRSSTPKPSAPPRTLPKVPKAANEPKKAGKGLRALPPVPPGPRAEGIKPSRSLPKVPGPLQAASSPILSDSHHSVPNPAIPTVPKGQRVLPKIPKLNIALTKYYENGKQTKTNVTQPPVQQDRKGKMHGNYKIEADDYLRKGELGKALETYNAALKLIPDNKSTLVARSRCFQLLGKQRKAMQDVDSALNLDPLFYEALYQKAELYYQQKEYDMAKVYFNKGSKQRPDIKAFHDGLEKTQDAINRTKSSKTRRGTKAGEMSSFFPKKKAEKKKAKLAPTLLPLQQPEEKQRNMVTPGFRLRQQNPLVRIERGSRESLVMDGLRDDAIPGDNEMTETKMKQILGRMYKDKKYLEQLVNQAEELNTGSVDLHSMAENGLDFLYDRVLYWVRQGRIIPPEAPILPPPKTTENLPKILSPRSEESGGKSIKEHRPRLLRKLDNDSGMQPSSWFRYLERKKVAEVSSRKVHQSKFLHVLEGQKLDLRDNANFGASGNKLTPLKTNHTINEEPFSPRRNSPRKAVRTSEQTKKSRKTREAQQREHMVQQINREMDEIELAYVDGRYNECINRAELCLNTVTSYSNITIPNVMGIIAKLHSYIGNAAIENRDYVAALDHHHRDLQIGEEGDDEEAMSRALGNLGRIYVFQNNHQKALELFSRKVPLCKTRLETAWLYHEIGNCFLVLGQYKFAMEAALRSLGAAEEAVEWSYQLQALVLLGVAEVKLKSFTNAINTFERARDQARMQGDIKAEEAITEAIHDVNDKIMDELKSARGEISRSERGYNKSRGDFSGKFSHNPRSRAEWSDYSSIFIPEDDGDVSLTETGYDTDYLHLDLDQLRSDWDTSTFGSQAQLNYRTHFYKGYRQTHDAFSESLFDLDLGQR